MERSEVAIVIPAYNEEKTVGNVVASILSYGDVIVVDDCSIDGTARVSRKAGAIVVSHGKNQGYDGALNSGFDKALEIGKKYIITFDADGQHDPKLVETYLKNLENDYELVLGVRPKKARVSEKLIGHYFRFRFGIRDILCGMKGYRIELLKLNGKFDHVGSIGSELSFFSIKMGARFKQVPVPIYERKDSPRFGNLLKSNLRIIRALLKIILLDLSFNKRVHRF